MSEPLTSGPKRRVPPLLWILAAVGTSAALLIFWLATSIPLKTRFEGDDAIHYMMIAFRFRSAGDAFEFAGDRTYGFPLFLYLVKGAFSVTNLVEWVCASSLVLFAIHLLSSVCFYFGVLKPLFQKVPLPGWAAGLAGFLILTYPALVTYTTTPLTDSLCVSLLMIGSALYFFNAQRLESAVDQPAAPSGATPGIGNGLSLAAMAVCGLILGYSIMVRPSFWPPVLAFYLAFLAVSLVGKSLRKARLLAFGIAVLGCLVVVLPALETGRVNYGAYVLQNPKFVGVSTAGSMRIGLSAVRVYWTKTQPATEPLPGVKDPFLLRTYGGGERVNSLGTLLQCLISKPAALPVFVAKKLIALFDVPHFQPYAVDVTPRWFLPVQRVFELLSFCGFLSMLGLCAAQIFFRQSGMRQLLPWAVFSCALIGMHSLMHIEGRYGLPVVPFAVPALFLAFDAARRAGTRWFYSWLGAMGLSAIVFLWQVIAWDALMV